MQNGLCLRKALFMIRLGIAGTNTSLNTIVPAIREGNDFQITGIYGLREKELFSFSDKLMIQPVIIPETLLMRADALLVIDDPGDYYEILVRSLQLSKHLFLSSLGSLSLKQIENLMKLSDEARVVVFHPFILEQAKVDLVKRYLNHPYHIEINCVQAFSLNQAYDFNELRAITLRGIEAMLLMNQGNVLRVHSNAAAILYDQADFVNTRVDFINGCAGVLTAGFFAQKDEFSVKIYQRNEILLLDMLEERLISLSPGKKIPHLDITFKRESGPESDILNDLLQFYNICINAGNSVALVERTYQSVLLTSKIFEKIQLSILQEKAG